MKLRIFIIAVGLVLVIVGGIDLYINADEFTTHVVTGNYATPGFNDTAVISRIVIIALAGIFMIFYGIFHKSGRKYRR